MIRTRSGFPEAARLSLERGEVGDEIGELLFRQGRGEARRHQGGDGLARGDLRFREGLDPRGRGVAVPDEVLAFPLDVAGEGGSRLRREGDRLISLLDLPVGPEKRLDDLVERHAGTDAVERRADHATGVADAVAGRAGELGHLEDRGSAFDVAFAFAHRGDDLGDFVRIILRRTALAPDGTVEERRQLRIGPPDPVHRVEDFLGGRGIGHGGGFEDGGEGGGTSVRGEQDGEEAQGGRTIRLRSEERGHRSRGGGAVGKGQGLEHGRTERGGSGLRSQERLQGLRGRRSPDPREGKEGLATQGGRCLFIKRLHGHGLSQSGDFPETRKTDPRGGGRFVLRRHQSGERRFIQRLRHDAAAAGRLGEGFEQGWIAGRRGLGENAAEVIGATEPRQHDEQPRPVGGCEFAFQRPSREPGGDLASISLEDKGKMGGFREVQCPLLQGLAPIVLQGKHRLRERILDEAIRPRVEGGEGEFQRLRSGTIRARDHRFETRARMRVGKQSRDTWLRIGKGFGTAGEKARGHGSDKGIRRTLEPVEQGGIGRSERFEHPGGLDQGGFVARF